VLCGDASVQCSEGKVVADPETLAGTGESEPAVGGLLADQQSLDLAAT